MQDQPPATSQRKPRLTEKGRAKLLAREKEACGTMQFTLRVKAVAVAHKNGDWKMLSGALEDLAAGCIAWSERVRADKRKSFQEPEVTKVKRPAPTMRRVK